MGALALTNRVVKFFTTTDGKFGVVTFDGDHPSLDYDFHREGPLYPTYLIYIGGKKVGQCDPSPFKRILPQLGHLSTDQIRDLLG